MGVLDTSGAQGSHAQRRRDSSRKLSGRGGGQSIAPSLGLGSYSPARALVYAQAAESPWRSRPIVNCVDFRIVKKTGSVWWSRGSAMRRWWSWNRCCRLLASPGRHSTRLSCDVSARPRDIRALGWWSSVKPSRRRWS